MANTSRPLLNRRKHSEIMSVLREINVTPVKSLGQNFLHDRNLSRWIVDQLDAKSGEYVVEIGPGLGALTEPLVKAGARILVLEKDARLANYLRSRFADARLEVRHVDALEFDATTLFTEPAVKLVGNLPYYISSQILWKFLEYPSPMSLSVLMLQKEMADRLTARPGCKEYGALTVLLQRHYHIKLLRRIPAAVFIPRPEVDSAVVRFAPKLPAELPDYNDQLLVSLVRQGFSQRRKQLGKMVREYVTDWSATAQDLGFDPKVRAESLSLDQWIALTNYLRPIGTSAWASQPEELFPVVDNRDQILGAAPRTKVHGDNLRHRAVHILIFSPTGEIYLQKRSRRKDRHPGVWDSSAAGHVLTGEDYDVAAERELLEELGITTSLEKIGQLPASDRTGQEFIWIYRGAYAGDMSLNREEIEMGRYFQPAIVTGWIAARPGDFAPGFSECWKIYLERCR